eukprot:TRINITY_DN8113_c0_g1_i1.p1 TRINITY_DN8113_c0_g1~~TRINITY_DN8113_c0_g1_i1.p1  ORF type:complete len:288 (+),score=49.17 TRINITY_DN8113_c0_g1_i1:302-1165(+)
MGVCASVVPEGGRKFIRKALGKGSFNRRHHHRHHYHHYSSAASSAANSRHSRSPSRSSEELNSVDQLAHLVLTLNLDTEAELQTLLQQCNYSRDNISPVFYRYGDYDNTSDFTKSVIESSVPPSGQNLDSWLLVQVLCFVKVFQVFHRLVIGGDCDCDTMSAGHQYEYRWRDIETGDVLHVGASTYMHFLYEWSESISSDQNSFSCNDGRDVSSDMARRLFRVYAHVFHEHYSLICSKRLSSEFDARLIHLSHFLLRYKMVTSKELLPMRLFFSGKVKHPCTEMLSI